MGIWCKGTCSPGPNVCDAPTLALMRGVGPDTGIVLLSTLTLQDKSYSELIACSMPKLYGPIFLSYCLISAVVKPICLYLDPNLGG